MMTLTTLYDVEGRRSMLDIETAGEVNVEVDFSHPSQPPTLSRPRFHLPLPTLNAL